MILFYILLVILYIYLYFVRVRYLLLISYFIYDLIIVVYNHIYSRLINTKTNERFNGVPRRNIGRVKFRSRSGSWKRRLTSLSPGAAENSRGH